MALTGQNGQLTETQANDTTTQTNRTLDTIGSVLREHSLVYKELRRGRIEPTLASLLPSGVTICRSLTAAASVRSSNAINRRILEAQINPHPLPLFFLCQRIINAEG
jgi:hypothetical protein